MSPAASQTNLNALFDSLTGVTVGRTDYGVDFAYSGKTSAHALGDGTIVKIGSGWAHVNAPYQTGQAVYIRFDAPIAGYPFMYYAEGTPAPGLKVGQRVTAGQQIMINPGEVGVIPTPETSTLYQTPQPSGTAFSQYLGTPSGAQSSSSAGFNWTTPGGQLDPKTGKPIPGTSAIDAVTGWVGQISKWLGSKALLGAATVGLVALGVWLIAQGAHSAFGTPSPTQMATGAALAGAM